jgi:hypothetical protein
LAAAAAPAGTAFEGTGSLLGFSTMGLTSSSSPRKDRSAFSKSSLRNEGIGGLARLRFWSRRLLLLLPSGRRAGLLAFSDGGREMRERLNIVLALSLGYSNGQERYVRRGLLSMSSYSTNRTQQQQPQQQPQDLFASALLLNWGL